MKGPRSVITEEAEQIPVTRTISRAMAILKAFDSSRPEMGVTEISQLTKLDKSTAYRLLSALQQGGLIEQHPETAKYHLGFGLVRLAGLALQNLDLPRLVRPHLQELADLSQETVNLSVMTDNDRLINIDVIASPLMVRNVGWMGREMPLHAVSGGKVMLAYLPEGRLNDILELGLPRITEHTVTEPARLRDELAEIQERGYGMASEELEIGLSAVAAPIWNYEPKVVAVLSVSGPSFRLPRERLIQLGGVTKSSADAISRQMGYSG
jgi:IclR family acetate operon transcriptional repressor